MLLAVASRFLGPSIGRWVEQEMNERLEGYSVRIGRASFRLLGLSLALRDVVFIQDAYADPPVARVELMKASVYWRKLLFAKVVADLLIERPDVHIHLQQLREEKAEEVRVEERGWLEALEAAYPLRIELLQVRDGSVAYIDKAPGVRVEMVNLQFRAEAIRSRRASEGELPSPFRLEGRFPERGLAVIEGRANFLHQPHPAVRAGFRLADIPLEQFRAILSRANIYVNTGNLSALTGEVDLQANGRRLHVHDLTIRGLHADYIYVPSPDEEPEEPPAPRQSIREWMEESGTLLQVDRILLEDGDIGLVNREEDPQYRIFLTDARFAAEDYSVAFLQGEGTVRLEGRFMGSGPTVVTGTFRPEEKAGPDFELAIRIEKTQMTAMNNIFRAYGNFDVVAGYFTFFAEFTIREKHIDGYMRPFFGDVEVYDRRQSEEKGTLRRLYERLVDAVAGLLENIPRDEVATHVEISGPLDDPDLSTWEIIGNLIRNAFFQAILPGFEHHAETAPGK
jgi:hypothetical protein